jgi:hypothetical protein
VLIGSPIIVLKSWVTANPPVIGCATGWNAPARKPCPTLLLRANGDVIAVVKYLTSKVLPMSSAMHSNPEQSVAGQEQAPRVESAANHVCEIPPMVAKSREAFCRDLPELLKERHGWWVAYHGDERIGFGRSQRKLYQECLRRGLTDDQFLVTGILPDAADESAEILTPWV